LTVTTSKAKYDKKKKSTFEAVNKVSMLAWLWLLLAVIIFVLLVVALTGTIEPVIVQIALKVVDKTSQY
jgi:hypothetical protein